MFDLAIWYRMVGGFIGLGSTQLGRLRFALIMANYMAVLSAVHHEGFLQMGIVFLACTVTTFLGRLISHSRFQATASIGNSLGMAVINLVRILLIVAPYSVGNWADLSDFHFTRLLLCLFGLGSGVAYYVGNKYLNNVDSGIYYRANHAQTQIPLTFPPSAGTNTLNWAAIAGSEWGELLTGQCYEVMFIFALCAP